jgi:hypothetical protein
MNGNTVICKGDLRSTGAACIREEDTRRAVEHIADPQTEAAIRNLRCSHR